MASLCLTFLTAALAPAIAGLVANLANAEDGLPDPGSEIGAGMTALVVTDPQIDFLNPDGVAWSIVGKNVEENGTV